MIAGWWSYPLLVATVAGSAVLPPVPSESAMVTAMSVALAGKLSLLLVAIASALGSALGDFLAYGVGRGISGRARGRAARSERGQAALRWVEEHEDEWGPGLIVMGRFIPGGTTAVGISAGIVDFPLRRFVLFASIGAALWSVYGIGLAKLGQAAFPGNVWASTAVAVALVFALSGVVHLWRKRSRRGVPEDEQP
jgi:membrane protein DedA with SNARE-associated domain